MAINETNREAVFFEGQLPALIDALERIADNLTPKETEQQVIDAEYLFCYMHDGWKFVGSIRIDGTDYAVVERERREEK